MTPPSGSHATTSGTHCQGTEVAGSLTGLRDSPSPGDALSLSADSQPESCIEHAKTSDTRPQPSLRGRAGKQYDPDHLRASIDSLLVALASTTTEVATSLENLVTSMDHTGRVRPRSIVQANLAQQVSLQHEVHRSLTNAQLATLSEAEGILADHVKDLSRYNAVKDAGLMLLGILAERKAVTVRDIMRERDLADDD